MNTLEKAFLVGDAAAIGETLTSPLGEQAPGEAKDVWRERAAALAGVLAPVLVWVRDHKGVPLNIDTIAFPWNCAVSGKS
jgi:intracellular multiplication protein IcmO